MFTVVHARLSTSVAALQHEAPDQLQQGVLDLLIGQFGFIRGGAGAYDPYKGPSQYECFCRRQASRLAILSGHNQEVLFAAWVPSSMPEPLVQKIQAGFEKAMKDGALRERMRINDMVYEGLTGDAAAKRIQALTDRYRVLAQATGMKME